jgi:methylamine---corrinoid protein Co-methyltransferase
MDSRLEKVLISLDRAHTGPICTMLDWDARVIPQKSRAIVKKYGLEKTYNPDEPINTDDALADTYFKAGLELAVEVGVLCPDTERVIKVEESEIARTLQEAPSEMVVGGGSDVVVMKHRLPEDPYPPLVGVPLCLVVSEDLWVPLVVGLVQKRHLVDIFFGPSLPTVYGHKVRSGTPLETLVGRYEIELRREALYRAGRPDMAQIGSASGVTEYGQLGGWAALAGPNHIANSLSPAELKAPFASFHKVIQGINFGNRLRVGSNSYIGGYAGTSEGAVVLSIAVDLLYSTIMGADYITSNIYDARQFGNCGREGIWANSVATQAVSRNTHLMRTKIINQTAGPCTEMLLYETAVGYMAFSVSGASKVCGPRSAGGKYPDYLTPLETWFLGEVFKSSAGMSRKQANEIAVQILPKYETQFGNPPKGKGLTDCWDLKRQQPSPEWADIYRRVHRELVDLGMPLRELHF